MIRFLNRLFGRSDIYFQGDLYMRRWRLGSKGWPGLRLHHIVRSDKDRELHDHPFWFVSLILRGGYREHYQDGTSRDFTAPALVFRKARELHRLELFDGAATWTLVLRGAYCRAWGFVPVGWIPWQKFTEWKGNTEQHSQPYRAESSL